MNWKKPITLALAATMTASLSLPALAANAPWYADAQAYVTEKGLMTGTDKGFDPNATVTRATVFQTLYNAEGKPEVDVSSNFTDVSGKWYADAAAWAKASGISSGNGMGAFNGDQVMTRGEIATVLARYAEYKQLDTSATGDGIQGMTDYDQVPAWALEGMEVCFNNGILSGKPGDRLAAGETATRAELAAMLLNFSELKRYQFDASKPYDAVFTGLCNDIPVTLGDTVGTATYYVPEGMQPYASVVIVLTPDGTTAKEFAESETGLAWRSVADTDKIAVVFFGPDGGKSWNLTMAEDGRDEAAMLNALYTTVRSRSLKNKFPMGVNRGHIALAGYEEGGAAALLFGTRYATNYSGIAAVDATSVPADVLASVGEEFVLPFTGDGSSSGEDLQIKAKTVDMPVWFIRSDEDNQAVVDYYVAANEAKTGKANEFADTTYEAASSDARIWISDEAQTPAVIYDQFLGAVKRLRGIAPGRVSFSNDYTREGFSIHEETINGELRRWITYVPSSYTGEKEVPLVVALPGYGASMYGIAEASRWYAVAEEHGFIVVFPQALVRETSNGNLPSPAWAIGGFASMMGDVDPMVDVNFLNTLLDKLEAEYKIDASRIYATGHSNGSMMTWGMGEKVTERFAAIAPIGFMSAPAGDFSSDVLLPTWAMVGEYDNAATAALEAGNATVSTLQAWNEHNGVDEREITESEQQDGKLQTMTFSNSEDVPLVRFTTILQAPHVYVQEASQTLWDDFFSKYSRGEDGTLYYEGKAVTADEYVASDDWYTTK